MGMMNYQKLKNISLWENTNKPRNYTIPLSKIRDLHPKLIQALEIFLHIKENTMMLFNITKGL